MTTKRTERDACERGDLLVTVLYGEATKAERAEFEAHRAGCTVCAEDFAAFGEVRQSLQGWEVERVPEIRVEIRPSLWERVRQSFVMLPTSARWVAAGACAMLLLAVVNTDLNVGPNGVSFRTGLIPRPAESSVVRVVPNGDSVLPTPVGSGMAVTLTAEQLDRLIAERTDAVVQAQLAFAGDAGLLDVHVQAERAAVELRRADVHQEGQALVQRMGAGACVVHHDQDAVVHVWVLQPVAGCHNVVVAANI